MNEKAEMQGPFIHSFMEPHRTAPRVTAGSPSVASGWFAKIDLPQCRWSGDHNSRQIASFAATKSCFVIFSNIENTIYRLAEHVRLNPRHTQTQHTDTDLVSLVATNTTGFGASPWLTFCRLMTDWEVLLMPEVYGLPLAGYGMPVACTAAAEEDGLS